MESPYQPLRRDQNAKAENIPFFRGCSEVAGVDMLPDMADMALAPNCPVHGFSSPPTQTDIRPITPAPGRTTRSAASSCTGRAGKADVAHHASVHTRRIIAGIQSADWNQATSHVHLDIPWIEQTQDAHPGGAQQHCSRTQGAHVCQAPQDMAVMGHHLSSSQHSPPHFQAHLH